MRSGLHCEIRRPKHSRRPETFTDEPWKTEAVKQTSCGSCLFVKTQRLLPVATDEFRAVTCAG